MEQLKHKSSDILISRVKENLSTYDSAGIIDSGKFYFYIKKELQLLGNYVYIDKTEEIDIDNGKALLPQDFIRLHALYSVDGESKTYSTEGIQKDIVQTIFTDDSCPDECDKDFNEFSISRTRISISNSVNSNKGTSHHLLRYSGKVSTELCDKDSANFHSKNTQEFNIDSNYIYTNFTKGKLILQYLAFPFDEDGYPMIPDASKIEEAIESYIMYKVFEYFYTNDIVNNALQKMQYYQQKYQVDHKSALNYVKLPSYQDSMEYGYRAIKNKFKIFELKRNGKYAYSTSNRYAEGSR